MHFCDLGGNTEIVFQQKALADQARAKGVTVIPDCGVAPGMVNILAEHGIRQMDAVESVKIYVGGLPQNPEPPLNYQIVYSLEGVLDYYTTLSWVLRDGKRSAGDGAVRARARGVPGAGRRRSRRFTRRAGCRRWRSATRERFPTMEYKTLRYPGHAQIMETIRDLGLLDVEPVDVKGLKVVPRDVFVAAVGPKLSKPKGSDLVALRVIVRGHEGRQARGAAVRARRSVRRDARHQRDDADDRLLAVDHGPDAGAPGGRSGRACGRRTSAFRRTRTSPSCGSGGSS